MRRNSYIGVLLDPKIALLFSAFFYLLIPLLTYSLSLFPAGVDAATHLFQIWLLEKEGFTEWNHWWYAGNPQLDQYPPLTHAIPAILSRFLTVESAYKIAFLVGFLFIPISFYLLLQEFSLTAKQKSISLYLFSFSNIFIHYFQGGIFSATVSIPFAILFFKYLVNYIHSSNPKSMFLSSIFLAFTALSHLFNPIAIIILVFFFLLSFYRNAITSFFLVCLITALLVAFFWVPFYFNYAEAYSFPSFSLLNLLLFPLEIMGRAFFSYFNVLSLFLLFLVGVALVFSLYIFLNNKDYDSMAFIFLFLIITSIMGTFLPSEMSFVKRISIFYPLFFGLIFGKVYGSNKKLDMLIVLLVILIFILFLFHEIPYVSEVYDLANWSSEQVEHRALFLPQGFEFLMYNSSKPNANEYLYSTYLLPAYFEKEVYNGWFGEMAPRRDINSKILFSCVRTKSFSELFSEITLFEKDIMTERKECTVDATPEEFCEILQEGAVDTIFVNRYFPEVVTYVENAPCINKTSSYNSLNAYRIVGAKPYVDSGFNYTKNSGLIQIAFVGPLEGNVTIRESYYPFWKAYLDGEEIDVLKTDFGFIGVGISVEEGQHMLELKYTPNKFFNIFYYLSLIAWFVVIWKVF